MTDQDKADPWAALASELGVESPVSKREEESKKDEKVVYIQAFLKRQEDEGKREN